MSQSTELNFNIYRKLSSLHIMERKNEPKRKDRNKFGEKISLWICAVALG